VHKLIVYSASVIKTFQFRIKDAKARKHLSRLSGTVNYVWNYCNATSKKAWERDRTWVSHFDLIKLMAGSSKDLSIHSDSQGAIAGEFVARRNKRKRPCLRWRTAKKNLGWIPFAGRSIKLNGNIVTLQKKKYSFWKSRDIEGTIRAGSFSQNSKGNWFVNLNCEVGAVKPLVSKDAVGIDLGLKTTATLSNGEKIENPKILQKYADKLAMAQRAHKKKLVTAIHNKIKNVRKDFLHKETTKLVRRFGLIRVGDVSSLKLVKTKMAKSVLDAGWGAFKTMLGYKAIALGIDFKVVNEAYSTVTCSNCFAKSGPSGLSALGVREFVCSACGSVHDRDVNSANNILRLERQTL
jgi:putative transposase